MDNQVTTTTLPVAEPKKVDTLGMARSCKGKCEIQVSATLSWCNNCGWSGIVKPKN